MTNGLRTLVTRRAGPAVRSAMVGRIERVQGERTPAAFDEETLALWYELGRAYAEAGRGVAGLEARSHGGLRGGGAGAALGAGFRDGVGRAFRARDPARGGAGMRRRNVLAGAAAAAEAGRA